MPNVRSYHCYETYYIEAAQLHDWAMTMTSSHSSFWSTCCTWSTFLYMRSILWLQDSSQYAFNVTENKQTVRHNVFETFTVFCPIGFCSLIKQSKEKVSDYSQQFISEKSIWVFNSMQFSSIQMSYIAPIHNSSCIRLSLYKSALNDSRKEKKPKI